MGFRISDLQKAIRVLGDFPLETVDTAEPNAANRSKYITLDQVRDFVLTGLPPQPAKWVTQPGISVPAVAGTQATFTVSAGQAQWPEGLVDYLAQEFTVALPGPGLQRIDTVVADLEGNFILVTGDTSQNPAPKKQPADTLWVNFVLFNEEGAEVPPPQSIDFDYANYTGKATPEDAAVFLVQESNGTKYKWNLSQLITWLGTKNIGAGGGGTTPLAFIKALPFDKDYLVDWTITGATAFTKNATNFKPGKFIKGNIKADGLNKPTFSADFIINYFEWVNTAGKQHRVFFEAQADGKITVDIVDA